MFDYSKLSEELESLIKKVDYALAIHAKGNIKQALIYYNQIIRSGIEDPRVYSALGFISLQNFNDIAIKTYVDNVRDVNKAEATKLQKNNQPKYVPGFLLPFISGV